MNASGAVPDRGLSKKPEQDFSRDQSFRTPDLSQMMVRRFDGTILFCTTAVSQFYGWPVHKMIGKSSHSLLQTEFPTSLETINSHLLRHGSWSGELARVRRDGTSIRVESHWALQTDEESNPVCVVEFSNEINHVSRHLRPCEDESRTLRIHAGLAVNRLDETSVESVVPPSDLPRQIIEIIPECIFVLDVTVDGRFKFLQLNPAEEKAVGLSSTEVAGKFIEDVLAEDVVRSVTPQYRRCLESGEAISYEGELNLAIGPRYFRSHLTPLRDASGRICRLVGCCHDLTDTRHSYQEALARQKLETIGALANGIAHDFNNLLGSILTSAELALKEKAPGSAVGDELERIRTASIRGAEIVRELMIYGGKESAVLEAVDMSALVEEMLQLLKIAVSKKAVVEAKLPKNLPAVQVNPTQLRQVVLNLVTNASDAISGPSGVIRVETSLLKVKRNSRIAPGLAPGDYAMLEVSDTGGGIAPELQSKVFDPFFTTKRDGRGLGLSIVQGIVSAHQGAINLVSKPGRGTTIQVLLPSVASGTQQRKDPLPPPPVKSVPQSATVLVVEDEELLRAAVTKALRKRGFAVIEASNGPSAIELLQARKSEINVALLDATLPGMTIREIYENLTLIQPGLRLLFTSAYDPETVGAALGGVPLRRFIRKPFQLRDLVDALVAAISDQA